MATIHLQQRKSRQASSCCRQTAAAWRGGRDGHKPVADCVGEGEGEGKLEPGETQVREGVEAVVAQEEGDVAEALAGS